MGRPALAAVHTAGQDGGHRTGEPDRLGSCRDAGESAVASVLETAGAAAAIWVSLPLFQAAWELLRSLL